MSISFINFLKKIAESFSAQGFFGKWILATAIENMEVFRTVRFFIFGLVSRRGRYLNELYESFKNETYFRQLALIFIGCAVFAGMSIFSCAAFFLVIGWPALFASGVLALFWFAVLIVICGLLKIVYVAQSIIPWNVRFESIAVLLADFASTNTPPTLPPPRFPF